MTVEGWITRMSRSTAWAAASLLAPKNTSCGANEFSKRMVSWAAG
jgi:hypothetical protein